MNTKTWADVTAKFLFYYIYSSYIDLLNDANRRLTGVK